MSATKYPFKVKLLSINGNVFNVLGTYSKAMKKNKCSNEEIQEFLNKATACEDYDSVLRLCLAYFEVI